MPPARAVLMLLVAYGPISASTLLTECDRTMATIPLRLLSRANSNVIGSRPAMYCPADDASGLSSCMTSSFNSTDCRALTVTCPFQMAPLNNVPSPCTRIECVGATATVATCAPFVSAFCGESTDPLCDGLVTPTPEPTPACRYIAAGWNDHPTYTYSVCVDMAEEHEVRCCADDRPVDPVTQATNTRYAYSAGGDCWGASSVDFEDHPSDGCNHASNFSHAKFVCERDGARLCTLHELETGCGQNTGCNHNADQLWSSTVGCDLNMIDTASMPLVDFSSCQRSSNGSVCTPVCIAGYHATSATDSSFVVECDAYGDMVSGPIFSLDCQPNTCDIDNITNAVAVADYTPCLGRQTGDTCVPDCPVGHRASGPIRLVCDDSGDFDSWTSGFVCIGFTPSVVETHPPGTTTLTTSLAGELLMLSYNSSDDGELVIIARSFEGHDWEPVKNAALVFACSSPTCSVELAAADGGGVPVTTYVVERVVAPQATAGGEASFARFLMQATFGPTSAEIAALQADHGGRPNDPTGESNTLKEWIGRQMALPPTLHRSYYRERANPRLAVGLAVPAGVNVPPCAKGSQWHRYAFNTLDLSKTITASAGSVVTQPSSNGLLIGVPTLSTVLSDMTATYGADRAIDGITFSDITRYPHTGVSINNGDRRNPWFQLFFTGVYRVHNITFVNHNGGCGARTFRNSNQCSYGSAPYDAEDEGAVFGVSNVSCDSSLSTPCGGSICSRLIDGDDSTTTYTIVCDPPVLGQYAHVYLPGNNRILNFFEFSVMGSSVDGLPLTQTSAYDLSIDGVVRTTVLSARMFDPHRAASIRVCTIDEEVGGPVTIGVGCATSGCDGTCQFSYFPHPEIQFDDSSLPDNAHVVPDTTVVRSIQANEIGGQMVVVQDWSSAPCPFPDGQADHFLFSSAQWYRYDPRLRLVTNTITSPVNTTAATQTCATAPKTFLNRETCKTTSACSPVQYRSVQFELNATILQTWYHVTRKPVYHMQGLRMATPYNNNPCNEATSRWQFTPGACPASTSPYPSLDAATITTITTVLQNSPDTNPYVRDINLRGRSSGSCSSAPATYGIGLADNDFRSVSFTSDGWDSVCVGGACQPGELVCWENIHPDNYNVYDASYWAAAHPGNDPTIGFNPIRAFAENQGTALYFPASHIMTRWRDNRRHFRALGARFGDSIDWQDLTTEAQDPEMADYLGAIVEEEEELEGFEACGSPGETANDANHAHRYMFRLTETLEGNVAEFADMADWRVKQTAFTTVSLNAADQLRQRMSWAMSQIWVIGEDGLPNDDRFVSEMWHTYRDIFTRHAFGNIVDVLREVSYSSLMARYLTFLNSRSYAVSNNVPDENYARELMQLFTIGLYELNNDGTFVVDDQGRRVQTYDANSIMSFARAWTGFSRQNFRGNLESYMGLDSNNDVDPMTIRAEWRDVFPKLSLYQGYLGDTFYPLCSMLPAGGFLRLGAEFRNLGSSPAAEGFDDPADSPGVARLVVEGGSALYAALCGGTSATTGRCSFPNTVTLTANLDCHGAECHVDTARVIQARQPDGRSVFFEYRPPACIQLALYPNATMVQHAATGHVQCADPALAAAGTVCCNAAAGSAEEACEYMAERVSLDTARHRCEALTPPSATPSPTPVTPVSCHSILADQPSATDGTYTIDVDGQGGLVPMDVYCDMSAGGWIGLRMHHDGVCDIGTAGCEGMIAASNYDWNPWYKCGDDVTTYYDWMGPENAENVAGTSSYDYAQTEFGSVSVLTASPIVFNISYAHPITGHIYTADQIDGIRALVQQLHPQTRMVATTADEDQWAGFSVHSITPDGSELELTPGYGMDCGADSWPTAGSESAFYLWSTNASLSTTAGAVATAGSATPGAAALKLDPLPVEHILPNQIRFSLYTGGGVSWGYESLTILVSDADDGSPPCQWVAAGITSYTTETAYCAPVTERHEVRCCSDFNPSNTITGGQYWTLQAGCDVWSESDLGPPEPSWTGWTTSNDDTTWCYHSSTFAEAQAICAASGARLCTREEFEADCTINTGCGHNHDLLWTEEVEFPDETHVCTRFTAPEDTSACASSEQAVWVDQPCRISVQVDPFGYTNIVHDPTPSNSHVRLDSGNQFLVMWEHDTWPLYSSDPPCGGVCTASGDKCNCEVEVLSAAVFTDLTDLPDKHQVEDRLFIGSPPPTTLDAAAYTVCGTAACASAAAGGVEVWLSASNGLDEDAIFVITSRQTGEVAHLLNRRSTVLVGTDGSFSFRNAPHFLSFTEPTMRDAEHETEAVIHHLLHHNNTAPFISHLLIQRFTTSNPSPRYVIAVTDAFRSGSYDGVVYSGRYGDLGATVAAILLDREARFPILDADKAFGHIREPMLKLYHLMRSLDYVPANGMEVELADIRGRIGQESFRSPSVFNFYLAEYQPNGWRDGFVAPEAQLGTGPNMLGLMNGLSKLIETGLNNCDGVGFGRRGGCTYSDGDLSYVPADTSSAAAMVHQLDLLLTAGRLSSHSKEVIRQAMLAELKRTGSTTDGLKMATMLMVSSAEFHTSNMYVKKAERRPQAIGSASQGRPYKAIVVLFLAGGVDSFNVLVPYADCNTTARPPDDCSAGMLCRDLYAQYRDVRTNVALAKCDELLASDEDLAVGNCIDPFPVPPGTQACDTFGITHNLQAVKTAYTNGDAAWISNIGTLVEPMTKAEYNAGTKRRPRSLFAHNIQVATTQNVHAGNDSPSKPKGVLGRMLEALADQPQPYAAGGYSLQGIVDIFDGDHPADILTTDGVNRFEDFDTYETPISSMLDASTDMPFAEQFNSLLQTSLIDSERLGQILDQPDVQTETTWATDSLSRQFQQVAKVIRARDQIGSERDVFFVQLGGFDTHASLTDTVTQKMSQISTALASFEAEMKHIGLWDNVVTLSASDFGRTLVSNGAGTDHAWGGNHFVVGGAVNGSQILGKFPPRLDDDSALNIRRGGRLLPTTSWEALWNGVAEWFGVDDSLLDYVLPNRANFPADQLFTQQQLFA